MTDAPRLQVACACGWRTIGTEPEVVAATQAHGVQLHNMEVTRDQVLAMSAPFEDTQDTQDTEDTEDTEGGTAGPTRPG